MKTALFNQLIELQWSRKDQAIIQTGRGARMGWRYFIVPESQG